MRSSDILAMPLGMTFISHCNSLRFLFVARFGSSSSSGLLSVAVLPAAVSATRRLVAILGWPLTVFAALGSSGRSALTVITATTTALTIITARSLAVATTSAVLTAFCSATLTARRAISHLSVVKHRL